MFLRLSRSEHAGLARGPHGAAGTPDWLEGGFRGEVLRHNRNAGLARGFRRLKNKSGGEKTNRKNKRRNRTGSGEEEMREEKTSIFAFIFSIGINRP